MNPPRCTSPRRINALSVALIFKAMLEAPASIQELSAACGLSLPTTRHYVLTAHREGVIHIAHWEQCNRGRYTTPAYVMGQGKDAVRPRVTASARAKAYRARRQQQEVLHAMAGAIA